MKQSFIITLFSFFSLFVHANDGAFYISGNQLIPIERTDIKITREVLTIRIAGDGFAYVDVDYTFSNLSSPQVVKMGFEAAIENDEAYALTLESTEGKKHEGHPNIYDFKVELNGQHLDCRNYFAFYRNDSRNEPLDYSHFPVGGEWQHADYNPAYQEKFDGWDEGLYNARLDSLRKYAHVYYFEAPFRKGLNHIHHTYRYEMGSGQEKAFTVRYWLTPAQRWAGSEIEDFTLRISTEGTAKHFYIPTGNLFNSETFRVVKGVGKVRYGKYASASNEENGQDAVLSKQVGYVECSLRNGILEWHSTGFKPVSDLYILSADQLLKHQTEEKRRNEWFAWYAPGVFYDRDTPYWYQGYDERTDKDRRILRNMPYANRGYIFKDKLLNDLFSSQWWYIPDAEWTPSTEDFTKTEIQLIEENK